MKSLRRFESTLATLLLLAGCFLTAAAQDSTITYPSNPSATTSSDPPGRVARVQYMSGEVSIQPGGVNDWIAASLNRPLTTSDRVWTDANSKAELSVGGGYIRLNSEASLTLTNVSDRTVQLELDQGALELTVRYLGGGQIYEVDTPNLAFTVTKPGVYRFDVFPQEDATWVTVRKGQGEATGRGNAVKIKSGEQARFGNETSLQHTAEAAPAPDGFDDWASVRDKRLDSSESARYVSPGVIGYEDLDTYGAWQSVAPYGPVWVPYSVPVGWAPYRFGRWVWIAPWGWTWVDNAAWGFAPFHYGRWVYTGGYWGWAPGPYRSWSPCYAPALVGWVGGPGWGLGFGWGGGFGVGVNFGWFPLGWGEPYYPWYHGWHGRGLSPTYVRNVNVTNTHITNVRNITNNYYNNRFTNIHYVNKTVNGAVTAAPGNAIASGQPINGVGQTLSKSALRHAPVMRSVSLAPTRAAMLGGQELRDRSLTPASASSRNVVTRTTPPPYSGTAAARSGFAANPRVSDTPRFAPQPSNAAAVRSAPRPSQANDWARGGMTSSTAGSLHPVPRPPVIAGRGPAMQSGSVATGNSFAMHPATEQRTSVPRPSSVVGEPYSPAARNPRTEGAPAPRVGAPPAIRPSAPMTSSGQSRPYAAGSYVPHPPAGYTYRAAPAYTGGSHVQPGMTGGRVTGNSYAPATRTYSAPSMPSRGPSAGMSAAPRYSAPSGGGHSAAPSGGAHYSAPSGGGQSSGASHAMRPSGGNRSR